MRFATLRRPVVLAVLSLAAVACARDADEDEASGSAVHAPVGPGADATDGRSPELPDVAVVQRAAVSLEGGLAAAQASGPVIEAKYELGDDGALSLSLYPAGKGLSVDAERNVFQELSGDPTKAPFAGKLEAFTDRDHLVRSSRDLTLVQLSKLSLADAVGRAAKNGKVYWAVPTIRKGRAGYGVYTLASGGPTYAFVDGEGSTESTAAHLVELGTGPGAGASDARTPELGDDLSVVLGAKITMAQALAQIEAKYGPAIEAKYELGDDGKLSLSIYPVAKGLDVDAERNGFRELAGDPTAATFAPALEELEADDKEHQTRSARDLTLVQTAGLTLAAAVDAAQKAVPGGFVYWAIPTIRDTRAGYGVYVLGTDKKAHYFFVS